MRTELKKLYADYKGVDFSIPEDLKNEEAEAVEESMKYFMDTYYPDIKDLVSYLRLSVEHDSTLCVAASYDKSAPAVTEEEIETALENFMFDVSADCCGYGKYANEPEVINDVKVKTVEVDIWCVENWYEDMLLQENEDETEVLEIEDSVESSTLVERDFNLRFGDERNWLFN